MSSCCWDISKPQISTCWWSVNQSITKTSGFNSLGTMHVCSLHNFMSHIVAKNTKMFMFYKHLYSLFVQAHIAFTMSHKQTHPNWPQIDVHWVKCEIKLNKKVIQRWYLVYLYYYLCVTVVALGDMGAEQTQRCGKSECLLEFPVFRTHV